jgi:hypothetical protein
MCDSPPSLRCASAVQTESPSPSLPPFHRHLEHASPVRAMMSPGRLSPRTPMSPSPPSPRLISLPSAMILTPSRRMASVLNHVPSLGGGNNITAAAGSGPTPQFQFQLNHPSSYSPKQQTSFLFPQGLGVHHQQQQQQQQHYLIPHHPLQQFYSSPSSFQYPPQSPYSAAQQHQSAEQSVCHHPYYPPSFATNTHATYGGIVTSAGR